MLSATLRADEAGNGSLPLENLAMLSHDDYDSPADRALFEHFLAARRRARGPVVCVNGRTMLMNAAADGLLQQEDVDELWMWACEALAEDDGSVHALRLRDMQLSAQCEAIADGSEVIGALIRVGTSATAGSSVRRRPDPKRSRASLGWESLRESELGIAQLVADGLTNREIGARLFMSRHTVDSYMRQIFRKLGIGSRVELTRVVVERAASEA